MSVADIANDLVAKYRQGQNLAAIDAHYSDDIVSIEATGTEQFPARQEGIEPIRGKNQWWIENHEIHGGEVNGPYIGEDQFAVQFKFDVTPKMTGQRMQMTEMGLYNVKNGKIVQEEFFYNMPGQ